MKTEIRIFSKFLRYESDIELFTALSGKVAGIASLYVVIERVGFRGVSEIRTNMQYYNGLSEAAVFEAVHDYIQRLDWRKMPDELLDQLNDVEGHAVARCAIEGAILEGIAIRKQQSVASLLGGQFRSSVASNNSLMWADFDKFRRLTSRFVSDGFKTLKVRIAVEGFDQDLKRIEYLKDTLEGSDVVFGVDVNCRWTVEEAIDRTNQLEKLGVAFVEQPTKPGDWAGLEKLRQKTALPIMLDEGCQTEAEVETLAKMGAPFMAHLKMLKLGGPRAMVRSAKTLLEGGVIPIVGQMNEGMAGTALAAQCAMAVSGQRVSELYGFYGLLDEPVSGLHYDNGAVVTASEIGSGFTFDEASATQVSTLFF